MEWAHRRFPNATKRELQNHGLLLWMRDKIPLATEKQLRTLLSRVNRLAELKITALSLIEPTPKQEEFHKSSASNRVVSGGNQCLGGETIVNGRRIDEINDPFFIESHCPETGEKQLRSAGVPWKKPKAKIYKVTLSNGQWFTASAGHLMLAAHGSWLSLCEAAELLREYGACHLASSSEFDLSGFPRDVLRSSHKAEDFQDCYSADHRRCDEPLHLFQEDDQASETLSGDVHECSHDRLSWDDLADTPECNPLYQSSGHPSSLDAQRRILGHDGASGSHASSQPYSPAFGTDLADQQSVATSVLPARTTDAFAPLANQFEPSEYGRHDVSGGTEQFRIEDQAVCQSESFPIQIHTSERSVQYPPLSITSIEYVREGIIYDMEVDVNENYVLGDVIHHNSGKSLCCSVEVARCALGRDPHEKYRQPNKRSPLIIFTVAYDAKSIGRRLYRYLFRWGAFDIVRDEKTNRWRVFIPGQDKESERMPAPPLIPQEEIAEIAWTQKRNREFNCVTLKNGTEIYAFPSKGDPPQGDQVDLYWIDEDIEDDEWVDEAHQRLSKRRGKFIWSALPKSKNTGLLDMLEMAKTQEGRESPDCVSWQLSLLDNPYIHADEKRKRVEEAEARGEDIVRLRIYGDPMSQSWLVYPQFSRAVHGITRDDLPGRAIPAEWTRYLITDPGRSRCGSLLAAVPPPHSEFVEKHGDTIVIYAEAVIEQCNSKKYAEALKRKMLDDEFYEWVMDDHFGRLSDHTAAGKKVKEYYAEELAQLGCTSIAHGPNFIPACDNINARVEAVCTALTVRRNGTPRLRVLADELPLFMLEISRYRNKLERIKGMMRPTDKPDKRKGFELMDCLEYACAHEMAYVEYDYKRARVIPWAVLRKKAKDAKKKESQTTSFVLG